MSAGRVASPSPPTPHRAARRMARGAWCACVSTHNRPTLPIAATPSTAKHELLSSEVPGRLQGREMERNARGSSTGVGRREMYLWPKPPCSGPGSGERGPRRPVHEPRAAASRPSPECRMHARPRRGSRVLCRDGSALRPTPPPREINRTCVEKKGEGRPGRRARARARRAQMAETHWYMFSMYSSTTAVGETKSQLATLYSMSGSSRSASDISVAIWTASDSFSFLRLGGPLMFLHGDSNFLSGTRSHSMPRQ
mmetsp:Transcript_48301/g.133885  ORF Transcript_48301/g.133885 Transcript_48301/m.133885 type:complete len:254 (-) Transcript_48301:2520-3281(-)